MKIERAILVAFISNYLINNVAAAVASFFPGGTGTVTVQYAVFVALAAITAGIAAWWYGAMNCKQGAIFGAIGFVTSVVAALVTGVTGVLIQTASFSTLWSVLPNFWTFLANWPTLVLLAYWVIPGVIVGWMMGRRA